MAVINYPIPDELKRQWKSLCASRGIDLKERLKELIEMDVKAKGLKA